MRLRITSQPGGHRDGLQVVLLVCTETSGADATHLALKICEELKPDHQVAVLLIGDASWAEQFLKASHVLIGPYPKGSLDIVQARRIVRALRKKLSVAWAIINGVAGRSMLLPFAEVYTPTVFLVDAYDAAHCGPYEMINALAAAGRTVFANDEVRDRAKVGAAVNPIMQDRVLAYDSMELKSYVSALLALAEDQKEEISQLREDVRSLIANPAFDETFFLPPNTDLTREQAVLKFARFSQNGVYVRKPGPGFYANRFVERGARRAKDNPFRAFLDEGSPKGAWQIPSINLLSDSPAQTTTFKVAVHVHAFYADVLTPILESLRRQLDTCDLFLSVASADVATQAQRFLDKGWRGQAVVRLVPNRGRDIGPFLTEFGDALSGYDVIGHFHTKKSVHLQGSPLLADWVSYLTENLLGSRHGAALRILAEFSAKPRLGMVFPEDPNMIGWDKNLSFALPLAKRLGIEKLPEGAFPFPVGTMFWARPAALAPLFNLKLGWQDYPQEPLPLDGTVLHALERMLPDIVLHSGYSVATTFTPGVRR